MGTFFFVPNVHSVCIAWLSDYTICLSFSCDGGICKWHRDKWYKVLEGVSEHDLSRTVPGKFDACTEVQTPSLFTLALFSVLSVAYPISRNEVIAHSRYSTPPYAFEPKPPRLIVQLLFQLERFNSVISVTTAARKSQVTDLFEMNQFDMPNLLKGIRLSILSNCPSARTELPIMTQEITRFCVWLSCAALVYGS